MLSCESLYNIQIKRAKMGFVTNCLQRSTNMQYTTSQLFFITAELFNSAISTVTLWQIIIAMCF